MARALVRSLKLNGEVLADDRTNRDLENADRDLGARERADRSAQAGRAVAPAFQRKLPRCVGIASETLAHRGEWVRKRPIVIWVSPLFARTGFTARLRRDCVGVLYSASISRSATSSLWPYTREQVIDLPTLDQAHLGRDGAGGQPEPVQPVDGQVLRHDVELEVEGGPRPHL